MLVSLALLLVFITSVAAQFGGGGIGGGGSWQMLKPSSSWFASRLQPYPFYSTLTIPYSQIGFLSSTTVNNTKLIEAGTYNACDQTDYSPLSPDCDNEPLPIIFTRELGFDGTIVTDYYYSETFQPRYGAAFFTIEGIGACAPVICQLGGINVTMYHTAETICSNDLGRSWYPIQNFVVETAYTKVVSYINDDNKGVTLYAIGGEKPNEDHNIYRSSVTANEFCQLNFGPWEIAATSATLGSRSQVLAFPSRLFEAIVVGSGRVWNASSTRTSDPMRDLYHIPLKTMTDESTWLLLGTLPNPTIGFFNREIPYAGAEVAYQYQLILDSKRLSLIPVDCNITEYRHNLNISEFDTKFIRPGYFYFVGGADMVSVSFSSDGEPVSPPTGFLLLDRLLYPSPQTFNPTAYVRNAQIIMPRDGRYTNRAVTMGSFFNVAPTAYRYQTFYSYPDELCSVHCNSTSYSPGCQANPIDAKCSLCTQCIPQLQYVAVGCRMESILGFSDTVCESCATCTPPDIVVSHCNSTHPSVCQAVSSALPADDKVPAEIISLGHGALLIIGALIVTIASALVYLMVLNQQKKDKSSSRQKLPSKATQQGILTFLTLSLGTLEFVITILLILVAISLRSLTYGGHLRQVALVALIFLRVSMSSLVSGYAFNQLGRDITSVVTGKKKTASAPPVAPHMYNQKKIDYVNAPMSLALSQMNAPVDWLKLSVLAGSRVSANPDSPTARTPSAMDSNSLPRSADNSSQTQSNMQGSNTNSGSTNERPASRYSAGSSASSVASGRSAMSLLGRATRAVRRAVNGRPEWEAHLRNTDFSRLMPSSQQNSVATASSHSNPGGRRSFDSQTSMDPLNSDRSDHDVGNADDGLRSSRAENDFAQDDIPTGEAALSLSRRSSNLSTDDVDTELLPQHRTPAVVNGNVIAPRVHIPRPVVNIGFTGTVHVSVSNPRTVPGAVDSASVAGSMAIDGVRVNPLVVATDSNSSTNGDEIPVDVVSVASPSAQGGRVLFDREGRVDRLTQYTRPTTELTGSLGTLAAPQVVDFAVGAPMRDVMASPSEAPAGIRASSFGLGVPALGMRLGALHDDNVTDSTLSSLDDRMRHGMNQDEDLHADGIHAPPHNTPLPQLALAGRNPAANVPGSGLGPSPSKQSSASAINFFPFLMSAAHPRPLLLFLPFRRSPEAYKKKIEVPFLSPTKAAREAAIAHAQAAHSAFASAAREVASGGDPNQLLALAAPLTQGSLASITISNGVKSSSSTTAPAPLSSRHTSNSLELDGEADVAVNGIQRHSLVAQQSSSSVNYNYPTNDDAMTISGLSALSSTFTSVSAQSPQTLYIKRDRIFLASLSRSISLLVLVISFIGDAMPGVVLLQTLMQLNVPRMSLLLTSTCILCLLLFMLTLLFSTCVVGRIFVVFEGFSNEDAVKFKKAEKERERERKHKSKNVPRVPSRIVEDHEYEDDAYDPANNNVVTGHNLAGNVNIANQHLEEIDDFNSLSESVLRPLPGNGSTVQNPLPASFTGGRNMPMNVSFPVGVNLSVPMNVNIPVNMNMTLPMNMNLSVPVSGNTRSMEENNNHAQDEGSQYFVSAYSPRMRMMMSNSTPSLHANPEHHAQEQVEAN